VRYPVSDFGVLSPANHNRKGDYSQQDLRNHTGVIGPVRHFVGIIPCLSGTSVSCSYLSSPSSQNQLDEYTTDRYFEKLAGEWKSETINISSIEEIVLHPAYQRIISMGPSVLPAIFKNFV
jgi:hypothetical protein